MLGYFTKNIDTHEGIVLKCEIIRSKFLFYFQNKLNCQSEQGNFNFTISTSVQ